MAGINGPLGVGNAGSAGGSHQTDLEKKIDDANNLISQMKSQGSQGGQGSSGAGGGKSLEELEELVKRLLADSQQEGVQRGQGGDKISQPDYQSPGPIGR